MCRATQRHFSCTHSGLRLAAAALVVLFGCGSHSTSPLPPPIQPVEVDGFAAWSPDGRLVAFHRAVASSLGPQGLYLLDLQTQRSQLLMPGDAGWPEDIRFSADSDSIVCNVAGGLWIASTSTGAYFQLPLNTNVATQPDWGPANSIFYRRIAGVDAGLWAFSLSSQADTAVSVNGGRIVGDFPRWNGKRGELAFDSGGSIYVLTLASSQLREALAPPAGHIYSHPRWIGRTDSLLISDRSTTYASVVLDVATGALTHLPNLFGESEAFAPAGDSVIVVGTDLYDSAKQRQVLFIRPFNNVVGAPMRQITFFTPP